MWAYFAVFLLASGWVTTQRSPSLAESMLHLIMVDGAGNVMHEPRDERTLYKVRTYTCNAPQKLDQRTHQLLGQI